MTADNKKPAKNTKKVTKPDIDRPGKASPSATSKPVIVSNRPLLKDPMVVDEEAAIKKEEAEKEELAHSSGPKVKPLEEPAKPDDYANADTEEGKPDAGKKPEPQPQPQAEDKPSAEEPDEEPAKGGIQPESDEAKPQKKSEDRAAEQLAQHNALIQKLIDSGKYELPINAVEKRKARNFVVLGIFLAILLALAWGDIAADAGLISIDGVKPVTHFFSN